MRFDFIQSFLMLIIVSGLFYLVPTSFKIYTTISKELKLEKMKAISEESFLVVDTFSNNTTSNNIILLKDKEDETYEVHSESLYCYIVNNELSEVVLDIKEYKDNSYYFLEDTKPILMNIKYMVLGFS